MQLQLCIFFDHLWLKLRPKYGIFLLMIKKNNVDIAEMYIYQGIFGTLFVQETRWHFFFKKNTTFWIAKKNIRFFLIRTTL